MKPTQAIFVSLTLLPLVCAVPTGASAANRGTSQGSHTLKLSDLTPQVIQERLQVYLSSPSNGLREKAARVIDLRQVHVETEGFNKDPKNAAVRITYVLKPGKTDSPAIKEMVNTMVMNFFKETLEQEPPRAPIVSAPPEIKNPIRPQPPHLKGLSERAADVVTGYFPGEGPVSFSAEDCFDVAYACYIRGLYEDALVLADRGPAKRKEARLLLVKGVCQLHLGRVTEAQQTAAAYQAAIGTGQNVGLAIAQERINDSTSARFWELTQVKHRS